MGGHARESDLVYRGISGDGGGRIAISQPAAPAAIRPGQRDRLSYFLNVVYSHTINLRRQRDLNALDIVYNLCCWPRTV
jgi:hypothetical protein